MEILNCNENKKKKGKNKKGNFEGENCTAKEMKDCNIILPSLFLSLRSNGNRTEVRRGMKLETQNHCKHHIIIGSNF